MTEAAATSDELAFIDRLLDSWAMWAHSDSHGRYSKPSLRYSTGIDVMPSVLNLSDEQFGRIDHAVAQLPPQPRNVIAVHYFRTLSESKKRKAAILGMSLGRYERLLHHAQLDVLNQLVPDVYQWQGL